MLGHWCTKFMVVKLFVNCCHGTNWRLEGKAKGTEMARCSKQLSRPVIMPANVSLHSMWYTANGRVTRGPDESAGKVGGWSSRQLGHGCGEM